MIVKPGPVVLFLSLLAVSLVTVGLVFKQQGWHDALHGEVSGAVLLFLLLGYKFGNVFLIYSRLRKNADGEMVGSFTNVQLNSFVAYFAVLVPVFTMIAAGFTPRPPPVAVAVLVVALASGLRLLLKRFVVLTKQGNAHCIAGSNCAVEVTQTHFWGLVSKANHKTFVTIVL
jgi:hypothetical protein